MKILSLTFFLILFQFTAKSQDTVRAYIPNFFTTTALMKIVCKSPHLILVNVYTRWGEEIFKKDTSFVGGELFIRFGESLKNEGIYIYSVRVDGVLAIAGHIGKLSYLPDMQLSFDTSFIDVGKIIEIPIEISNLLADGSVIAYQFDFNFDNTKLEYIGNSLTGTLSENGFIQTSTNPTGKLSIAWARQTPMIGGTKDTILKLQFKSIDGGATTPTITNALFNTTAVTSITNGTITATYKYGDIDVNDLVQAYDAALAIQYSVGLNPLPTIDPIPWENWRAVVANVDGTAGVTANDASEILKYTVGSISVFPVESGKKSGKSENADVTITLENNELIFQSTGELFGLNVNVSENISALGRPQFLNANMLNATNITANNYAIGLATTTAPIENETFMKIPINQNVSVTFDMIINTTVKSVTVSGTTGIVTINDKAVSVYPNPTSSILYISGMQNANIQLFDLSGKLLINQQNADNQINVSNLQNGIYSVKITNESGTVVRKFVKQ